MSESLQQKGKRMNVTKRSLLKGIAFAGLSFTTIGKVTAQGGKAQYVVIAQREDVGTRLERAGFTLKQSLADGQVLIVHGSEGEAESLRDTAGVRRAARDVQYELELPARCELPDANALDGQGAADWYENLWDKQNSEVVEANKRATGAGTSIGIIDTGIDYAHPDLTTLDTAAGRLFRTGDVRSGAGTGIIINNPDAPADPEPEEDPDKSSAVQVVDQHVAADVQGHGTHVGGIAAADPETGVGGFFGSGVQGVAPDATLMSCRVFWWEFFDPADPEEPAAWGLTTTTGDILTAIDYCAENDLDVVNLSLGTAPIDPSAHSEQVLRTIKLAYEQTVRSAVNRGTVVVASAGNADTDLQRGGVFSLPNSTNGALSVSALGPNDERAFFSNYGTSEIDVGAGGGGYETFLKTLFGIREWILAGAPLRVSEHPLEAGDEGELWLDEDGAVVFDRGEADRIIEFESPAWPYPFNLVFSTTSPTNEGAPYGWKAGTSMSAPNTAGLVALARELEPEARPAQVESAIKKAADSEAGRSDPALGAGRINAKATVDSLGTSK